MERSQQEDYEYERNFPSQKKEDPRSTSGYFCLGYCCFLQFYGIMTFAVLTGLAYSGSERLLIGNSKDKKSFGMHFLIALGICLVLFILSNIGIAVRNKKRYGGGEEDKPREYANYEGADQQEPLLANSSEH